jgi:UDP-N-acetylglucosamine 2-epimerase (non-hydrolysing)
MVYKMKVCVILGTRPEIIKMAPVIKELERRKADFFILYTGQHYSYSLNEVFFQQLELLLPKYDIGAGSGSHAEETGKMLIGIEKVLFEDKPDIVLIEGDTNSILAGALAAVKLHIKIGHAEAGLRSYDRSMPEEINRILTDHISDFLFTPTEGAKRNLLKEGIPAEKIFVTGNTIVDVLFQNLEAANREANILQELGLNPKEYFLVTAHRQENVDDIGRFEKILRASERLSEKLQIAGIYPIHPRSRKRMEEFGLHPDGIRLLEPLDFLNFLQLEANARLILSDSGGVQEESCILQVPCVTLRDNTERPETLEVGANILAGAIPERILECSRIMLEKTNKWRNPFGDGKAGERIANIVMEPAS